MNKDILEFNRKCVKFLEWKVDDLDEDSCTYETPFLTNVSGLEDWEATIDDFTSFLKVSEMLFHCDWNWIMLVVQKIQQTEIVLPSRYKRGFLKTQAQVY